MNNEMVYLEKINELFVEYEQRIKQLTGETEVVNRQVIALLKKVIQEELSLRKEYDVEGRFTVIQRQLQKLLDECEREAGLKVEKVLQEVKQGNIPLTSEQKLVYVYLFNAQGNKLKTWQNLLSQHALMEHSVNRPIYGSKEDIEKVMRAKVNVVQHGYIEVVVNAKDILESLEKSSLRDQYGHVLIRLRQGALTPENIRYFCHEGKEYQVVDEGTILDKKEGK